MYVCVNGGEEEEDTHKEGNPILIPLTYPIPVFSKVEEAKEEDPEALAADAAKLKGKRG